MKITIEVQRDNDEYDDEWVLTRLSKKIIDSIKMYEGNSMVSQLDINGNKVATAHIEKE